MTPVPWAFYVLLCWPSGKCIAPEPPFTEIEKACDYAERMSYEVPCAVVLDFQGESAEAYGLRCGEVSW